MCPPSDAIKGVAQSNASRMSSARHWRGVCRPPKAAPLADAVTVPKATPPDFLSQRLEPKLGAAEADVGSIRWLDRRTLNDTAP